MIREYFQAAMEKAGYEIIDDPERFYGEIPGCRGVWATGKTLEECRRKLEDVLDGWLVVRLQKGLSIPPIEGQEIEPLGPEGPSSSSKHPYMVRGDLVLAIPSRHGGEIGADLLDRFLKQAEISREEWDSAD